MTRWGDWRSRGGEPRIVRAAAAIGLVGAIVLTACTASMSPSSAPTSSISPSSSLPTIPVSDRYTAWQRVAMPDPTLHVFGGEWAADVIAFKGEYFAFGFINGGCCDGGFTTDTRAVVWSSPDGQTWRLEPDLPAFALGHMVGAATDGSRILVVGFRNLESAAYPGSAEPRGAVWTSTDGATWTLFEDIPRFNAVTFFEDRFWAAANGDVGPEVWSTTDGVSWTSDASAAAFGSGSINVLRSTSLGVVAAGFAEGPAAPDGSRTNTAVTWLLDESGEWHRAQYQPALRAARVGDVADLNGRLFAVGANEAADGGLSWESDDGLTWTRMDEPAFAIDCGLPHRIIATPSGLLAVGAKGCSTAQFRAWVSPDGRLWSIVPEDQPGLHGQELQVQGWLVLPDGTVLAVGYGSVSDSFHAAPMAWLVEP